MMDELKPLGGGTDMPELLPCPFCKYAEAKYWANSLRNWVECINCSALVHDKDGINSAIRWNSASRHPEGALPGEILEKVRKELTAAVQYLESTGARHMEESLPERQVYLSVNEALALLTAKKEG